MTLTLELSDTEILMDMQGVLFHVNMELMKRRIELETKLKDQKFSHGDFKGKIVSVDEKNIRVKPETGTQERSLPISRTRIRQLLADINRK